MTLDDYKIVGNELTVIEPVTFKYSKDFLEQIIPQKEKELAKLKEYLALFPEE